MRLTRVALLAGLLVVPALLTSGCRDSQTGRVTIDSDVNNAKLLVEGMKQTWASGQTTQAEKGSTDSRMALVAMMIQTKLPYKVGKRVDDDAKKQVILAKIDEVNTYITGTLVPKFRAADQSKNADEARALVPLADELSKKLDELNKTLQ